MTTRVPALVLALAALLGAACGQPPVDRADHVPPAAFQPEAFPDIPAPPKFIPAVGEDHLAMVYAGGAIRRYHVVLRAIDEDGMRPAETIDWYGIRLVDHGWTPLPKRRNTTSEWQKARPDGVRERLVVEAGRADKRTTIRLTLIPEDDAATAAAD